MAREFENHALLFALEQALSNRTRGWIDFFFYFFRGGVFIFYFWKDGF
jgi:hypothetical protein